MEYILIVKGRLPGLNEYIDANRTNKFKGAKFKERHEQALIFVIKTQLKNIKIDKKIFITYHFFEPNKRRDLDNISAFAHKVIQDALVKSGIIKNDGWKEIVGFKDTFYIDKERPRIEVVLQEVET